MADTISIPLNKKKLLVLLAGCLVFTALGGWILSLSDTDIVQLHQRRFRSSMAVHGLGLACIALFGFVAISCLSKLFDFSPGLVLNDQGLIDNTSLFSNGFIAWADISGIHVRPLGNQRLLYLMLRDPEQYMAKHGFFKRTLIRASLKHVPSPIMIAWPSLGISFDELVSLISEHLSRARAQRNALST